MGTSFLTRDEFHGRVDALFDRMEEHFEEDAVAVIGELAGSAGTFGPSDSTPHFRIQSSVGYPHYAFDEYLHGEGIDRFNQHTPGGLYGTLLLPRSDLSDVVLRALDGDEEAQESLAAGEVPADD